MQSKQVFAVSCSLEQEEATPWLVEQYEIAVISFSNFSKGNFYLR